MHMTGFCHARETYNYRHSICLEMIVSLAVCTIIYAHIHGRNYFGREWNLCVRECVQRDIFMRYHRPDVTLHKEHAGHSLFLHD